jgi:type IV pilus assembly protein PilO
MNFDLNLNLPKLDVLRPVLSVPVWQCAAGLAGTVALLLVGFVALVWMPEQDKINGIEDDIIHEQTVLQRNSQIVKQLPRMQVQFKEMKRQLQLAKSMLPEKSQIPDLLEGVSRAGKDAGLEFSVFQPLPEEKKVLHAEVPVTLNLTGTFRQVALFLRTVGEMQRIVDIKNLNFVQASDGTLQVSGQAVTYRLLDDQEIKQQSKRK